MLRLVLLKLLLFLCFILIISIPPNLSLDVELGLGSDEGNEFKRDDFPPSPAFVFGASSSAYQVEGAADQDGRTPSILDTYAHAGNFDGATGDVACDAYHKYKEDVQLMVDTGLEAYRFSISWSRLIPNGRGPVNPKGLQYYNNLIDQLISKGIQPHVTLHHSDLPQALEDEYGGWVSPRIVKDFTAYANVCFEHFGDRVGHWTTMNEPNVFVLGGYDIGFLPPQRCSAPFGVNCSRGNSTIEPYMAIHNILLAHASAATLYKKTYQHKQRGFIGINLFSYWFIPQTQTHQDQVASQRALDFYIGWVLHPLVFGEYPQVMKKNAGSRIPTFTSAESSKVKGSFDFIGLNYYLTLYAKDNSASLDIQNRDCMADSAVRIFPLDIDRSTLVYPITPWGLEGLLEYIKQNYGNPPLYIHENGQHTPRNSTLEDWSRIKYLHGHIHSLLHAIRNGSNTRGYFIWSFLDSLEILDGYESSYGLYYIDLDDPDLKRQPKLSAHCSDLWSLCCIHCFKAITKICRWPRSGNVVVMVRLGVEFVGWAEGSNGGGVTATVVVLDTDIELGLGSDDGNEFKRDDFPPPPGFVFGASSFAYQVQGAADQDGRTPSIWDTYAHAGNYHGATGDVACDEYHKYKEGVQVMLDTGLEAYRFSISWSRLIPIGRGPVNPKGLQYYNNLIDQLISKGIQPHVTLHHSDLPQALEDEYGGWFSPRIVKDFTAYANVCFEHCYTVQANLPAQAAGVYRYQSIGLLAYSSNPNPSRPSCYTKSPRFLFWLGFESFGVWRVPSRLNYYITLYAKDNSAALEIQNRDYVADAAIHYFCTHAALESNTSLFEFPITPWGLEGLVEYIKQNYGNPPLYIHENGQRTQRNSTLEDRSRIKYLHGHIHSLLHAIRNGSNTRGYFTWSLLDSLEILDGYKSSFGLYYIDLDDPDLKRQPKFSAHWYSKFLKNKNFTSSHSVADGFITSL
ncbi:hypothetical protein M0R45_015376 [Rubus argutus]|uniref:Beta-glucosidase n=1 Tax=Rubus argutus TaxID=59490 RepID=A0AAW1XPA9_RUBAR